MQFKNTLKTLDKIDKILQKEYENEQLEQEDYEYLLYMDFPIAESLIKDLDKISCMKIANHIIAHCKYDLEN